MPPEPSGAIIIAFDFAFPIWATPCGGSYECAGRANGLRESARARGGVAPTTVCAAGLVPRPCAHAGVVQFPLASPSVATDPKAALTLLKKLLAEARNSDGSAAIDKFSSLRSVDAKVREVKLLLKEAGATELLFEMGKDPDFEANSRRVRLEALANYCETALRFFDQGVTKRVRSISRGPDLSKITAVLPDLEGVIQERWLEAQRCQHAKAYLAAVIVMGSIIEGLLLARVTASPADAYRSRPAPKDRTGKPVPLTEWNLHTLIEVAVDLGWLKSDRGAFSHALRESRNVVHPWEHVRSKSNFDERTCITCWHVLNSSVDDLLASI